MNEFWTTYGTAIATAAFWIIALGICAFKIYHESKKNDKDRLH